MADKIVDGIYAGSVSMSIPVVLRVKSDGAELTGKLASNIAVHYWRQGGLVVTFTAATLASADGNYSAGGWFEMGSGSLPGLYRLDLPNTALSTGADWVVIGVKDTAASGFLFYQQYGLPTGVYPANDSITSAKIAAGALVYDDQITTFKSELSGMAISIPNDHITSAKIAAGALVYDDQIVTFKSELSGLVVAIPDGHITAAKIGNDAITSAKVAAGALVYDDQILTFKSELSGLVITIPNDHITSAKIAAGALVYDDQIATFKSELSGMAISIPNDHITSAKIAAGALVYDDQIVTFKSELSGLVITIPNDHITSAKVAAGALTYDDQITTFKSELSGLTPVLTGYRLSTQGVRDVTQYTSAMGGVPGSSPALIDAIYWGTRQAYQIVQTPTTALVYDAAGAAIASAPISGTSLSVTRGIFTNV